MKLAPRLLSRRLITLENKCGGIIKKFGGSLEAWRENLDTAVANGEMGKEDADMLYIVVAKWVREGL